MEKELILTTHARLRMKQNRLYECDVQKLWRRRRRLRFNIDRKIMKFQKYQNKESFVEMFWADGYILTVDTYQNVLITITKKPRSEVSLEYQGENHNEQRAREHKEYHQRKRENFY